MSVKTFCSWFQVDLNPFKQALVNTVCKWGAMFKEHLINNVTQRYRLPTPRYTALRASCSK